MEDRNDKLLQEQTASNVESVADAKTTTTNPQTENFANDSTQNQSNPENSQTSKKKPNKFAIRLDNFFGYTKRGSSFKKEFLGGLVNFLVLSYTLVVIPGLFNGIGTEAMWKAMFLATILTTVVSTVCMALYANIPIALAPGIGLCSYAVQLIEGGKYTFEQTMALCLMASVAFVLLTLTGLRKKIVNAIPKCIKVALPTGVGLFVLNIGLSSNNSGILDLIRGTATSFAPLVALFSFFVMAVLYARKVNGGIFIGILSGTVLDIILKFCTGVNPFAPLWENSWVPPFKELFETTMFKFDFAGLFGGNIVSSILSVLMIVYAIMLIDMFDTVGTLYATAEKGNLYDENGEVLSMNKAMLVDGCGAIMSSCFGIPSVTSYVESSAGIASGARTGLATLFTSLFFLISMFISPLIMIIPVYATAPALILVGITMFDSVLKINFNDLTEIIPAVLTVIIMPLTSNITYGIAMGLISYTILKLCTKRAKEINALTYVVSALFILYFVVQYI